MQSFIMISIAMAVIILQIIPANFHQLDTLSDKQCQEWKFIERLPACFSMTTETACKLKKPERCRKLLRFKDCLLELAKITKCSNTEFFKQQLFELQPIIMDIKDMCHSYLPKPEIGKVMFYCSPIGEWQKQFKCAKTFSNRIKKIKEDRQLGSEALCQAVGRYYNCISSTLHSVECSEDNDLMNNLQYFPRTLTLRYRRTCESELQLGALMVARKLSKETQSDTECREEEATRQFFACGLTFSEVVQEAGVPKDKLCKAYANFRECFENIKNTLNCDKKEFATHSNYVFETLVGELKNTCNQKSEGGKPPEEPPKDVEVKPPNVIKPGPLPVPPPVSSVSKSKSTTHTPDKEGCLRDKYFDHYFSCGLEYVLSVGDTMFKASADKADQCLLAQTYKACLEKIPEKTKCKPIPDIEKDMNAVRDKTISVHAGDCQLAKFLKIRHAPLLNNKPLCQVRDYVNNYFTCGSGFVIRVFYSPDSLQLKNEEKCVEYEKFHRCLALMDNCVPPTNIKPYLDDFTSVLVRGLEDTCQANTACDVLLLSKKFHSCGTIFYQAKSEFYSKQPKDDLDFCKMTDDYNECLKENVFKTDCKDLSNFMGSMKAIAKYLVTSQGKKCQPLQRRQRNSVFLFMEQSMECNKFNVIKKVMLCGVGFHNIARRIGNYSRIVDMPESCWLVKEMNYCIHFAIYNAGCSTSPFFVAELGMINKTLLGSFDQTCASINHPHSVLKLQTPKQNACNLEGFALSWQECDYKMESDDYKRKPTIEHRENSSNRSAYDRYKMCRTILAHHSCLNRSAASYQCDALMPEMINLSSSVFDRLGVDHCNSAQRNYCIGIFPLFITLLPFAKILVDVN